MVVVAAGNYGRDNPTDDARLRHHYGAGQRPFCDHRGRHEGRGNDDSTDDLIASYSSKGPTAFDLIVKPDLVAPGNLIIPFNRIAAHCSASILQLWITQTSTPIRASNRAPRLHAAERNQHGDPVVSAAAALLMQQNPTLTPDQVKARLMLTANKTTFPASARYTDPVTGITYAASTIFSPSARGI